MASIILILGAWDPNLGSDDEASEKQTSFAIEGVKDHLQISHADICGHGGHVSKKPFFVLYDYFSLARYLPLMDRSILQVKSCSRNLAERPWRIAIKLF